MLSTERPACCVRVADAKKQAEEHREELELVKVDCNITVQAANDAKEKMQAEKETGAEAMGRTKQLLAI
jgi:hypothetical protein